MDVGSIEAIRGASVHLSDRREANPGACRRASGGGFTLRLVLKDMELGTASMGGFPVLGAVAQVCRAAVEEGLGAVDLTGLGLAARRYRDRP